MPWAKALCSSLFCSDDERVRVIWVCVWMRGLLSMAKSIGVRGRSPVSGAAVCV